MFHDKAKRTQQRNLLERGMIYSPERDEFIHDVRVWPYLTLSEGLSHVVAFCFGSCPYDMVRGYDTYGSWFLSGPMIWFSQVINLFCLASPNKRLPSAYLFPHSSPLTTNPLCLCSCHSALAHVLPLLATVCHCVLLVFDFATYCVTDCHCVLLCARLCYCVPYSTTVCQILILSIFLRGRAEKENLCRVRAESG